jgi:ABC-type cobalamin/Fe3+-siderophores transport system ATPase subunit
LKSGSSQRQPPLEFELTPITVFVGPNNSGKSKALLEIEKYSRETRGHPNNVIIDNIIFTSLTKEEIEDELSKIEQSPNPSDRPTPGYIFIGKINPQDDNSIKNDNSKRFNVLKNELINEAQDPPNNRLCNYSHFLSLYTLRLDGTNRLNLLNEKSMGDLQGPPINHLAYLFANNDLRKKVRNIIYEAFKQYLVLDPTNGGKLRVRFADTEPTEQQETGLTQENVEYHKKAVLINDTGDGVKAFCGIIAILMAGDPKIILIDEPEAFLHPALSNKLGNEIGRSLQNSDKKRFIASTHSASFLMGCIQSGAELNIIRLTYKNGIATSRLLPKDKILDLMRKPLLRSTGVLNGLFFESVIVTEGDSDRVFYQEINERLLSNKDNRGINNCLFLNAQNKQTICEIIKPLRELGIPVVGIYDFDILEQGGNEFTNILKCAFIPEASHTSLQTIRSNLKNLLKNADENNWKTNGIELLEDGDREACLNFFNQLEEYGIFVVRKGELESWLSDLNINACKRDWVVAVFKKMEDNSNVIPSGEDVWEFIGSIKKWIENPNIKGIPS